MSVITVSLFHLPFLVSFHQGITHEQDAYTFFLYLSLSASFVFPPPRSYTLLDYTTRTAKATETNISVSCYSHLAHTSA